MSFLANYQFEICFLALGLGTLLTVFRLRGWMGRQALKWGFNLLGGGALVLYLIPFSSSSAKTSGYLFLALFLVFLRDALNRLPGAPASSPTTT